MAKLQGWVSLSVKFKWVSTYNYFTIQTFYASTNTYNCIVSSRDGCSLITMICQSKSATLQNTSALQKFANLLESQLHSVNVCNPNVEDYSKPRYSFQASGLDDL